MAFRGRHSSEAAAGGNAREERAGSFAGLAGRISGWTTNLLATGIVLLGGLALGWQVVGWWKEEPPSLAGQPAGMDGAGLPMLGKDREFWTRGGRLKVERVAGGLSEANAAMRAFCREGGLVGERAEAGKGEAEFVEQLFRQTPLEEAKSVAVYQPVGQRAMVVGVDRESKRIVGWSFALPGEEGKWSVYHFRPASPSERLGPHPNPLPEGEGTVDWSRQQTATLKAGQAP